MKINDILTESGLDNEFTRNFSTSFYHGSENNASFVPFRFRKAPSDTALVIHNEINQRTERKFGLPVRNLLFITPMIYKALEFASDANEVVPEGAYRMFTVPGVVDLTNDYNLYPYHGSGRVKHLLKDVSHLSQNPTIYEGLVDEMASDFGRIFHTSKNFEDFRNNIQKSIEETNKLFKIDFDMWDAVKESFDKDVIGYYRKLVQRYVDDMVEVSSEEDITGDMKKSEFMLYAPNGFHLI